MGAKGTSKYSNKFHVGDIIGKWCVVSPDIVVDHESKILCKCECGIEKLVSCYTLVKGTSKSCITCYNSDKTGSKNNNWRGIGLIPANLFRTAKTPEDRLALSITWENANNTCALTGWEISITDGSASPDRINSLLGYTVDNIQWVHKSVNIMKNMFELDHFVTVCHAIANNTINPHMTNTCVVFGKKN